MVSIVPKATDYAILKKENAANQSIIQTSTVTVTMSTSDMCLTRKDGLRVKNLATISLGCTKIIRVTGFTILTTLNAVKCEQVMFYHYIYIDTIIKVVISGARSK